ncbi:MAG: hypothetical protein M3P04_06035 [Actinomycetota bacterium]|nr:hypothetical protein [Actinomycetota bacterium]
MRTRTFLVLAVAAISVGVLAPARAAPPGQGHLVYVDSSGTLASVRPDGRGYRSVVTPPGWASDVEVSPDGRWVAFTRQPEDLLSGGLQEVWVARADLTGAHSIASEPGLFMYQPTWSPDSTRLAFVVGYPAGYFGIGYQAHVWVMGRDGSGKRPVAVLPGAAEQPTWAPRGSQVAFVVDAQEASAAIATVDVDAVPPLPRTLSPLGSIGVTKPHWSPSGDRLAYMDATSLYVVRADGSGLRRVSDGNNYPWNGGAVWSPDGRQLAYCLSSSGYFFGGSSGTGPWIVNATGRGKSRLLDTGPCFSPAWSPNGRSLAYVQPGAWRAELVVHGVSTRSRNVIVSGVGIDLVWTGR